MPRKITHEEFISRLEQLNKDRDKKVYLVEGKYVNQSYKLLFECQHKHQWYARPGNIMIGQGCKQCKLTCDSQKKRAPYQDIVEQLKQVHNNKFEYIESSYISKMKKMDAMCPIHGKFSFVPFEHIEFKRTCPDCSQEERHLTNYENFVKKANTVHNNKYSYPFYEPNGNEKISIICKHHGSFKQKRDDHIKGHGCPKCVNTSISIKQISWLNYIMKEQNIFIQHACNKGEYRIPELNNRSVDGFCAETNTVYQFHGDCFHGNLNVYSFDEKCHPFDKNLTAGYLNQITNQKDQQIIDCGYNLIVMWESEFENLNIPLETIDYEKIVHQNHVLPHETLNTLCLEFADDVFKGYKYKHNYKCLLCNDIFTTTLTQRKQSHKQSNSVGCSNCSKGNNTSNAKTR